MDAPAAANTLLCVTEDAAAQVVAAVRFILQHQGLSLLSMITHSCGSMRADKFTGKCDA
jgi:hypothetical protein